MENELVTVRTYTYEHEAYMAKVCLEENKLEGFIQDANTIAVNPLYSNALGGVKLQVRKTDLEVANRLLEEYKSQNNDTADNSEKIYLKDKVVKLICAVFWKAYFILMIVILLSSLTKWSWIGLRSVGNILNIVGLIGLFGYSFNIKIMRRSLWKIILILFIPYIFYGIFFEVFPQMAIKYSNDKAKAYKITIYAFVFYLPYFIALASYAFKRKDIWNNRDVPLYKKGD